MNHPPTGRQRECPCSSQQTLLGIGARRYADGNRRAFLAFRKGGLGGVALAYFLATEGLLADEPLKQSGSHS